ncbi:hypothetical protein L1276_003379 [Flavobacterium sp. HSC-32F16]|uniref:hypothetical protein n=1 Tax=Flavobacterium sp. HSC-32F16 TaxID=2910964 RepID=UPI0020A5A33C|nr:hypothetical protein [Flavobacterium sp. HSC-32F16]MCP2028211.1 hypothetical protein [Flavobacterium sp. HSC-32F16]
MKKTALTFGLFSLVMVATSFANPTQVTSKSKIGIDIDIDLGGEYGKNKRKQDVYSSPNQFDLNNGQLNSFASDSQLTKSRIKLD